MEAFLEGERGMLTNRYECLIRITYKLNPTHTPAMPEKIRIRNGKTLDRAKRCTRI